MPNFNMRAMLFYKDENVIIHSIMDEQVGRYFLSIPVNLYQNFSMLVNSKGKDFSNIPMNDINTRNQLINNLSKINDLIKNLNTNMVFSRTTPLKELPINELINVLNPNQPFNQNMYLNIIKQTENIINEDFNIMISPNLKQASIEQAIIQISQKEKDPNFINWLKNNLMNSNDYRNIDLLKQEYQQSLQNNQQKINTTELKFDIEDYKEVINNGKKYIVGLNSNNQMVNVEIPDKFINNSMLELFQMEFNTIQDKNKLANLTPKQVATVLFDKIISDTNSKPMENNFDVNNLNSNPQNTVEQNVLNNAINQKDESYIIDKENNIAVNKEDNTVMAVERDNNNIVLNEAQAQTYQYNEEKGQPQEVPTQVQQNVKKRVLVPPKNDYGFIKVGTIILFAMSFILTIISLVLLIAS